MSYHSIITLSNVTLSTLLYLCVGNRPMIEILSSQRTGNDGFWCLIGWAVEQTLGNFKGLYTHVKALYCERMQGWFYACAQLMRDVVTKKRQVSLAGRKPKTSLRMTLSPGHVGYNTANKRLTTVMGWTPMLNMLGSKESLSTSVDLSLFKAVHTRKCHINDVCQMDKHHIFFIQPYWLH